MFIGRKEELEKLKSLMKKKTASLVVIRGRRRIGKSRLAQEFAKFFPQAFFFEGLAPVKGITSKNQKEEFVNQMRRQKITRIGGDDWTDHFWDIAQYCKKGKILVIFDEISWMGYKDPLFLGKLKIAWDQHFKQNNQLIMILSGSNSTWIEKNILSSTGFFGRVSKKLKLKELPLHDCNQFWGNKKHSISAYEKFKILSVIGGIPLYLEEIQPELTAEENIRNLCFEGDGLLFNDFEEIFSTLFYHRTKIYYDLAKALVNGPAAITQIINKLKRSKSGDFGEYLKDMSNSGFVTRDYTWNFKNGKPTKKISLYRLSDNYLRFYLKYIEPNKNKIEEGQITNLPISWLSIVGLQFENLVLNNRLQLYELLGILPEDIIISGPFLQPQTKRQKKCQVDLIIQTKFNNLFICEIKFERGAIKKTVVNEMQEKIKRLKIPKGFSIRTVLIHVNGVEDCVINSDYFSKIIDFGQFLE